MNQPRRIIYTVIAALIIILVISISYHYLSTGTIAITTNDAKSLITVTAPGAKPHILSHGHGSVRLAPGKYVVDATSAEKTSTAIAQVTRGQQTTINIALISPALVDTKGDFTAKSIVPDATGVTFLNTPFNQLFHYNGTTTVAVWPDIYPVSAIYWLSAHTAYILKPDGSLQYIDNGRVASPTAGKDTTLSMPPQSFAINSRGELAYVANKSVVVIGQPGAASRVVASLPSSTWGIALSERGDILLYDTSVGIEKAVKHDKSRFLPVDGSARDLPDSLNFITSATLSPDGAQLVYTSNASTTIYNLKANVSGASIALQPTHPGSATWTGNTKFLYAQGTAIWLFDLASSASAKISDISGSLTVDRPFTVTPDGQVYFGTDPSPDGSGGQIYHFKL